MADQPTKAMTPREAVEIDRKGPPDPADYRGGSPHALQRFLDDGDRWYRARAIVDAAVLFVEDCEKDADGWDDAMLNGPFKKLRALERGEEPKP